MKNFVLILIYFAVSNLLAQTGAITDMRDGRKYKTITIGNNIWLREHLKYETKLSYFPNGNKKSRGTISMGNYYSSIELDSVCPKGWHVATIEDWEDYFEILLKNNALKDSLKIDTLPPNNAILKTINGLDLFKDSLLNLIPIGWVQGNKIKNQEALALWIINNQAKDNKYHAHIGPKGYIRHTHDHHIIARPKRIRKFAVRCVCENK